MTTKLEQAARQALEALEHAFYNEHTEAECSETITAILEALAEQTKPQKERQDFMDGYDAGMADAKRIQQAEQSQLADATLEPVASVEEWVARPHPEDIKRLQEQRSVGHWDSHLNDIVWREGLVNADLQHGQPLYAAPVEPVKQEPVGVFANVNALTPEKGARWEQMIDSAYDGVEYIHLYAAPVRTKDLTDDEAQKLWNDTSSIVPMWAHHLHFARAVIAKFKEKNK